MKNEANLETPFLMFHGKDDQVVQHKWGKLSFDRLNELGYLKADFNSYSNMGHSSSDEEISDLSDFLIKILP